MTIKELFEKAGNKAITFDEFETLVKDNGAKFADLSDGKYVSKSKYDTDLKAKDTEIETLNATKEKEVGDLTAQIENLNSTITTRDTDLADLQKKLEEAGNDSTKLAEINEQFNTLQSKYDNDVKEYQAKMAQQQYEFACKEFANSKKFSSKAAKRDFTQAMIAKGLQMEDGKLIGGDDFVSIYSQENEDAFYVEPEPIPETPKAEPQAPIAEIVASADGSQDQGGDNDFHFNFTGVRGRK